MRTTISLDDALLADAKQLAARTGRSLGAVIEEALRQALARRPGDGKPRPALPTYAGDGLQPGVDLDDAATLLDLLEGRSAAP
ncbi:MAG TPA: CopG family transcriptional regulator [Acidimicrobiales bacterium]|nr:CopG family transcriptional regulator [Acidimicrobiales bacterium]